MIRSASPYPVHALLSVDSNVVYRVPAYQRGYSWGKTNWEALFTDLVESTGPHFLGTIITVDVTKDVVKRTVLELVDGQQRATTLTLLLAAVHAELSEHRDGLDDDDRNDLINLGRRVVTRDGEPRVTPQIQDSNLDDYRHSLRQAGFKLDPARAPASYGNRRIAKCFRYFRSAIRTLAENEKISAPDAARRVLDAAQQAILVKIEVESFADAFVLFGSLNNRGTPLTPVDLIKTHLLSRAHQSATVDVDDAFAMWTEMLTHLGDHYPTQERFLRHFYNAFKAELPTVTNAPVATRSKLFGIYEKLFDGAVIDRVEALLDASRLYSRIICLTAVDSPTELDRAFRRLLHIQGTPSYVLLLWLLTKRDALALTDAHLVKITDRLTAFFVRRNLTGTPQTYALPALFMTVVDKIAGSSGTEVVSVVSEILATVSASDDEFRRRLNDSIYDENTDVARFILATLSEDAMTEETSIDLWAQENGHFKFTIEHILPQGANLPSGWIDMLGGPEAAALAQHEHRHRLGNLTLTAYNSTLGNKSFPEKRDRTDARGRRIGYRNGLALNADLASRDDWTVEAIESRTGALAQQVIERFPLSGT
ncbi:DUF262 domain-containing protein [Pseudonocardia alni]|uniref:DUF262 domain-containing protein n=1 Tax=Pseudonocardia alni TaxID=33907 RepID=UPI001AD69A60|nr:DUF262 domain-containing protein [Pseudonocardia alni]MBO4236826.1 DUF262 domain-containing protein [Pseudonocardia alni]